MKEIKDIDLVVDMVKDNDDIKVEGSVMSRNALLIIKGSVVDNILGKVFKPANSAKMIEVANETEDDEDNDDDKYADEYEDEYEDDYEDEE